MAQAATIYSFEIQLSDVDRGVYEALSLRVARQPSETAEYLISRVLAYCLEYTEGISFSRGLAVPDEPALAVRDLTGVLLVWIDVGAPDWGRVHKASKTGARVAIYTHKDAAQLARQLAGERIHRVAAVELYGFQHGFIDELAKRLERRMVFALAINDRHLYVTLGNATIEGAIQPFAITAT